MNHEIDQASLDLMIELQLQDAQNVLRGKHREEDVAPDTELAMELFKRELESLASFCLDQAMTRSIALAVLTDGDVIRDHVDTERQDEQDREQALHLEADDGSVNHPLVERQLAIRSADTIEDDMMEKLVALYIGDDDDTSSVIAESSAQGARRQTNKKNNLEKHRRCNACLADVAFFDTVQCPCSHNYCRDCIAGLFNAAINDESLFPPRCCRQPIPLGLNQIFLPAALVGRYRAKELEYGTPNRTYCHQSTCSTFIPPQFIRGDSGTCVKCHVRTCVICKGPSHDGDCPQDVATMDLVRVAADNGWQRCYSCRSMVELNTGCNHITCRCGSEFCYVCGVKWKECGCDQWDEDRLVDRANAIVDRDAHMAHMGDEDRALQVERQVQNLVENHECGHGRWTSRGGRWRCEECRNMLPQFIYECRNCHILACRRCRFNRL